MKVRELLDRPERWCQGALARDGTTGAECDPHSEFATCWCVLGAVSVCYPEHDQHSRAVEAMRLAIYRVKRGQVGIWNDAPGRTFEEVRELVERLDI